jgi:hypothetical protein
MRLLLPDPKLVGEYIHRSAVDSPGTVLSHHRHQDRASVLEYQSLTPIRSEHRLLHQNRLHRRR